MASLLAVNFVGLNQVVEEFSREPDDEDTSGDMSIGGGGTKLKDL